MFGLMVDHCTAKINLKNKRYAVDVLGKSWTTENAIEHLAKAIELDEHESGYAAPAHYYMALALIKKSYLFSSNEVLVFARRPDGRLDGVEVGADDDRAFDKYGEVGNEEDDEEDDWKRRAQKAPNYRRNLKKRKVSVMCKNKAKEHLNEAIQLINGKLIPSIRPKEQNGEGNAENTALSQQIAAPTIESTVQQFIAKCPADHFCKFNGWIEPDPDKKLPQNGFGVIEFYTFSIFHNF
ncbi:hypothetical protein GPALN_009687 [Globodera pallida]|nr:hypothetical protein GPALN_009687 [Globodera pallida]